MLSVTLLVTSYSRCTVVLKLFNQSPPLWIVRVLSPKTEKKAGSEVRGLPELSNWVHFLVMHVEVVKSVKEISVVSNRSPSLAGITAPELSIVMLGSS